MTTYAEVARALPVSTQEQTRAFARFLTGAHSWYKHLPIFRECPFYFYLDPNAGRDLVRVSEDEVAFVDKTEGGRQFHYTWQTTESYLRRFGHWNYEQSYSPTFMVRGEAGVVDTAGKGLQVRTSEGDLVEVPKTLIRTGTALVNALMYESMAHMESPEKLDLPDEFRIGTLGPIPNPAGPRQPPLQLLGDVEQALPRLPEAIAEALRPLVAFWAGESYQREFAETRRPIDELFRKAEAMDLPFGKAVEALGSHSVHERAREIWERTESRRAERALLLPVIAALDCERRRQVDSMVDAMNRFIAELYASPQ